MEEMKVLVAEDDSITQRIVTLHLSKHGFAPVVCGNGNDALKLLENESGFCLIISDIMMPDMNGLELLRLVKQNERTAAIPFFILTGNKEKEVIMAAINSGCQAYILKPVNPGILMSSVFEALGIEREE